MIQKAAVTQAGVLILLALVIAAVLEAVARILNLLNTPVNPLFLAAGAVSAAFLSPRGRA